uniref:Uncharacterized protein n=1 Tax=Sus scrofa TaxID=9823 RepID=A0A8W4FAF4_PIG
MSSANNDSFTTFFKICIYFISFSSLIVISRTSKTMLNKSVKRGHTCLVPDLSRNAFSFSPLTIILGVGLSYMPFIVLSSFPL